MPGKAGRELYPMGTHLTSGMPESKKEKELLDKVAPKPTCCVCKPCGWVDSAVTAPVLPHLGNGVSLFLMQPMAVAKGRLPHILCTKATEKRLEDAPATRLLRGGFGHQHYKQKKSYHKNLLQVCSSGEHFIPSGVSISGRPPSGTLGDDWPEIINFFWGGGKEIESFPMLSTVLHVEWDNSMDPSAVNTFRFFFALLLSISQSSALVKGLHFVRAYENKEEAESCLHFSQRSGETSRWHHRSTNIDQSMHVLPALTLWRTLGKLMK